MDCTATIDEVVRDYRHKVFRLAFSILGQEAAAEDAAQEVFVKIWRGLPGFRGGCAIATWIYAITRNTCLTIKRREAGRVREIAAPASVAHCGGALEVRQALDLLPEEYRRALRLFYLEGRSYDETAAMLGLPLGTLKTHLHRARKELARLWRQPAAAEGVRT
jgi:RNA polymerase sigma-70 factor (ECF subfamily)